MHSQALPIALFAAYVLVRMVQRARRSIGPQKVETGRLTRSIVFWGVISALILVSGAKAAALIESVLLGMVLGAVLAVGALKLTRFETRIDGRFYTVPSYIGLGIAALLLVRIAYRFVTIYPLLEAMDQAGTSASSAVLAHQVSSPLTMGLFGLLAGYYLAFYGGILLLARAGRVEPA